MIILMPLLARVTPGWAHDEYLANHSDCDHNTMLSTCVTEASTFDHGLQIEWANISLV